MNALPVIFMGISSLILQILCLRQLIATFSGNELIIGITLAIWLMMVAAGSYIGSKITISNAFGLSFLLVALVSQITIMLIKLVGPAAGFELGEVIPLTVTIPWTLLSLGLLCIIIGVQFPLAVSYLREKAPEVYSFEALGAFAGGTLFTFLFAGRVDVYQLALVTAVLNMLVSFYLVRKKGVLILLIVPVIIHIGSMRLVPYLQYGDIELVERIESRYGELTVLRIEDQLNMYSSEKFQYAYPDQNTEELSVHLPMSFRQDLSEILVIGGSPAVVREYLKYPITAIDFVEIDPVLLEVAQRMLSPADRSYLNDSRVTTLNIDARRFIKSLQQRWYDLIVLNIPEPSTANINRFYTVDFFEEVKAIMKADGIFCLHLPTSSGYIGKRLQRANGSIYASLKKTFPVVEVSSEEYGIIAASPRPLDISPEVLSESFNTKMIDTKYFGPYILDDAFAPLKVVMVKERFGAITDINSDLRPVSYLYNLMLWAEIHGGKWLNSILGLEHYEILAVCGFLLIVAAFVFAIRKSTVPFVLFTTGFSTLAFSLVIILYYQASFGYVYEMIGLLTGTFMLGGAAGAYSMRRQQSPRQWLVLFDILAILIIATSLAVMKREPVFYMMIFIAGFIGGGQFATANRALEKNNGTRLAGRLYAIDLMGSFFGSLLTAIITVPLLGMPGTVSFLVAMKVLSLGMLLFIRIK